MSSEIATYAVEVEVIQGNQHYGYYPVQSGSKAVKGVFIKQAIVKMFHFENVTRERAIANGKKHGKVKSCEKVDPYESLLSIEHLELNPPPTVYGRGNPYPNAIAMESMCLNKKRR